MAQASGHKRIWITGASSGIGAALSQHYAGSGKVLGLTARDQNGLETVAAACRAKGATVYSYQADVTDAHALRACSLDFLSKVGQVDLVIANAGIRVEEDDDYQNLQIQEETMKTNFLGVVHTLSPFILAAKKNRRGHLAVVSSISAFRGTPNSGVYSASKAALNLWTESLRLRLKPYGVNVTTLCVGFVDTPMTATLPFWMPGLLSPEQAAKNIAAAISRGKRLVTIPWQSKIIWNLLRVLPGSIYDQLILFLARKRVGPAQTDRY
ncbi:MAG: Fatty acyl-CoA reductase [Syntrophorhabdus sp. PtaU1.Bin153]|nr:MAG: Fatty acyl-CoA reductase [Syntrophorhabdus sp. PtaU1.Bin153]